MKKTIKSHEEKETKQRQEVPEGALPAYLLDREKQSRAKILSNTIKQKRKEKAVSGRQIQHRFAWKYSLS